MSYLNIVRNIRNGVPKSFDPNLKPDHDGERAAVMRRLEIYDTPSEEIFSAYTELAALTFKAPIGLMSFVDVDTVFYKQAYGVERTGQIVDRKNSPCSLAIMSKDVTQFRYALSEPCVLADEKTLAGIGYKFYAGAPMITKDGFAIGILAVVDKTPRVYSDDELKNLKELAIEVMREVELRYELKKGNTSIHELNLRLKELHKRVERLRHQ
ncbi:MAG: GAF domain-containing protein [Chryseolinea sp.]